MKVAIVGAGFAGIATARVLHRLGHDITIYEAMPDVGGVWSCKRSYPGLSIQSTRFNALSELEWRQGLPKCPAGPEVQTYLETYVKTFGLDHCLRLGTVVVAAVQSDDKRWTVTTKSTGSTDHTSTQETFDHLVVCNGTFNVPFVPDLPGREAFEAAGGQIIHSSAFTQLEAAAGKDVLVVGYGKSACDVAVSASSVARRTTLVARRLQWKFPAAILGIPIDAVLTPRLVEALFLFKRAPGALSRLLNGPLARVRSAIVAGLQGVVQLYAGTRSVGLQPEGTVLRGVGASLHVLTPGLVDRVREGKIAVHRDTCIRSLGAQNGCPARCPADLVIAGSGWRQSAPFLQPDVLSDFTDAHGNFLLYRWIKPPSVENLWFNGYCGSICTPTSAEIAALWIATGIQGELKFPSATQQRREAEEFIQHMETNGIKHAHGTQQIPFTYAVIDTLLADLGAQIGWATYLAQWVMPLRPAAYKSVVDTVVRRLASDTR
ncbi:fad-dependent oxidoreductase [Auriculariales sp. MPI-PUGE-AT-0066]|nr:fad-dependent oxidoreductase [Auriculariales sp. MPI-PUGE-AT-0066]